MFSALCDYKNVNGDCNVPAQYKEKPALGRWVNVQRTTKKKGRLTDYKIKRLEKISIVWELRKSPKRPIEEKA
jgi:Helicase associated domain